MNRKRTQLASVSHFEDRINHCRSFFEISRHMRRNIQQTFLKWKHHLLGILDLHFVRFKRVYGVKLLKISFSNYVWKNTKQYRLPFFDFKASKTLFAYFKVLRHILPCKLINYLRISSYNLRVRAILTHLRIKFML